MVCFSNDTIFNPSTEAVFKLIYFFISHTKYMWLSSISKLYDMLTENREMPNVSPETIIIEYKICLNVEHHNYNAKDDNLTHLYS